MLSCRGKLFAEPNPRFSSTCVGAEVEDLMLGREAFWADMDRHLDLTRGNSLRNVRVAVVMEVAWVDLDLTRGNSLRNVRVAVATKVWGGASFVFFAKRKKRHQ